MPEGDAVFLTAQRLHTALAGDEVTRFDLRVAALALADKRGARIVEVRPYAKHILMRFDDETTLHSHLRMDGFWRVRPSRGSAGAGPAHAVRAVVGTANAVAVGVRVHDLALLPTAEEHSLIGHLGPDLLSTDLDEAEAVRRLGGAEGVPIGVALLDQRLVAGLGTIWRSEVLWLHQVSPFTPVTGDDTLGALVHDASRLLRDSVDRQMAAHPRDPFRAQEGRLEVYGRAGRPCRRCGTPIEMAHQGPDAATERIVYFCPRCQDGP